MLWLILAASCSVSVAMIFKYCEQRGLDRIAVLTMNYLVATVIAFLLRLLAGATFEASASGQLVSLGIATGALFIVGFVLFSYAIRLSGMGLATGVMRISVVLPVLASWVLWKEAPTSFQLVGLLLAGIAFFFIAWPRNSNQSSEDKHSAAKTVVVLVLLFLAGGLVDVSMKAFGELFAGTASASFFLLMVFGVAFLLGLFYVIGKGLTAGSWPTRNELGWGVLLGVVNYGSAAYILKAIAVLPGPFVFPVNNILIVGGAAAIGVGFWKEHLSKMNWIGLGMAALALVFLWS